MALHTIEICAGVGMLGEGLRAGLAHLGIPLRTCCYVEREAYAASVLAARSEEGSLDPAPIWSDLLTFDAGRWAGAVDGIVAGFPCQDLSLAGRRAGLDGKRSGLFFNILDIADDCGAWFLFLENVAGIASATSTVVDETAAADITGERYRPAGEALGEPDGAVLERAAARVLGELAERGWNAEWLTLSASDVGASHGRERWFCFAWRAVDDTERAERWPSCSAGVGGEQGNDSGRPEAHGWSGKPIEVLGHARLQHQHLQQREDGAEHPRAGKSVADTQRPCDRAQEQAADCGRHAQAQRPADQHGGLRDPCVRLLFAPGPADQRWRDILRQWPEHAPALEPDFRGVVDGMAFSMEQSRAQRLKCVGNGVVPAQAAAAFVQLARRAGMKEAA